MDTVMTKSTKRFFEARPESVGQARKFTAQTLADWGLLGCAEKVRLCVSELATNALIHGTAPGHGFLVRLEVEEEVVRVEVHDSCRQRPEARQATATDISGRGLTLVSALADGWGVEDRNPLGKIVWSCFKVAGVPTP